MKIAVINFSGNVGKTTITAHLLKNNLPNAHIYSIESINAGLESTGVEATQLHGKKFDSLMEKIMVLDDAIIDIGASNVEAFITAMKQQVGSHEEFDLFIVPTTKERKVVSDTYNTISMLSEELGVPKEKIQVIFNKIDPTDDFERDFATISFLTEQGICSGGDNTKIYQNDVYELLKDINKSLSDITNDPTDYRQKLREETDEKEKVRCIRMVTIQRLAKSAEINLNSVYKAITS